MERTYEFGVMLSIGMSRSRLMAVVLVECAMLGLIGTLSGSVLGWLVDRTLNRYPIDLSRYIEDTSVGGFFMDMSLRSNILLNHFIIIVTLVFLTILIVGIYPAWKAGRIEPVDALHSL
jgi:putative ABC transport system permease protein